MSIFYVRSLRSLPANILPLNAKWPRPLPSSLLRKCWDGVKPDFRFQCATGYLSICPSSRRNFRSGPIAACAAGPSTFTGVFPARSFVNRPPGEKQTIDTQRSTLKTGFQLFRISAVQTLSGRSPPNAFSCFASDNWVTRLSPCRQCGRCDGSFRMRTSLSCRIAILENRMCSRPIFCAAPESSTNFFLTRFQRQVSFCGRDEWPHCWRPCGAGISTLLFILRRAIARRNKSRATGASFRSPASRTEEHTSELQSLAYLVCRLLLEKKKK